MVFINFTGHCSGNTFGVIKLLLFPLQSLDYPCIEYAVSKWNDWGVYLDKLQFLEAKMKLVL